MNAEAPREMAQDLLELHRLALQGDAESAYALLSECARALRLGRVPHSVVTRFVQDMAVRARRKEGVPYKIRITAAKPDPEQLCVLMNPLPLGLNGERADAVDVETAVGQALAAELSRLDRLFWPTGRPTRIVERTFLRIADDLHAVVGGGTLLFDVCMSAAVLRLWAIRVLLEQARTQLADDLRAAIGHVKIARTVHRLAHPTKRRRPGNLDAVPSIAPIRNGIRSDLAMLAGIDAVAWGRKVRWINGRFEPTRTLEAALADGVALSGMGELRLLELYHGRGSPMRGRDHMGREVLIFTERASRAASRPARHLQQVYDPAKRRADGCGQSVTISVLDSRPRSPRRQ